MTADSATPFSGVRMRRRRNRECEVVGLIHPRYGTDHVFRITASRVPAAIRASWPSHLQHREEDLWNRLVAADALYYAPLPHGERLWKEARHHRRQLMTAYRTFKATYAAEAHRTR
ncbi:MAG TPA: hypothetical protein VFB58_05590 [Chloroflexota bacterium]|nr:hypothetical protein [Chloroflexota bacterium]